MRDKNVFGPSGKRASLGIIQLDSFPKEQEQVLLQILSVIRPERTQITRRQATRVESTPPP